MQGRLLPILHTVVLECLVPVWIDWPGPPDVRLAEMQGRSVLETLRYLCCRQVRSGGEEACVSDCQWEEGGGRLSIFCLKDEEAAKPPQAACLRIGTSWIWGLSNTDSRCVPILNDAYQHVCYRARLSNVGKASLSRKSQGVSVHTSYLPLLPRFRFAILAQPKTLSYPAVVVVSPSACLAEAMMNHVMAVQLQA